MKNTIYYKVIDEKTRYGSNMWGYLSLNEKINLTNFFNKYKLLKPFFPKYKKGSTIIAKKGTLGIFAFQNEKDAEFFVESIGYNRNMRPFKVIRVSSSCIPRTTETVIGGGMSLQGMNAILKKDITCPRSFPIGSFVLNKVKVLD